eukprot:4027394-Amphidinium_carterae.1
MACGDIVWAMPPNPPHIDSLACEYLLLLALWHGLSCPRYEGDRIGWGKLAKFWLHPGCEGDSR